MGLTTESRALSAMCRVSEAISSASNTEEVLSLILKETIELIPVTKASIMRYDSDKDVLRIVASIGMPSNVVDRVEVKIGEGVSGQVFESNKPLLTRHLSAKVPGSKRKKYRTDSFISAPVTCFPMKMKGRPVGVINLTDKVDKSAFTPSDLAIVTAISNQTASYLHLCDLVEKAKRHKKMEEEIELARKIQTNLFPKQLPDVPRLDLAANCWMAEKVGGDYYDLFCHPHSPLCAIVADVAGHNVAAALTMASFRSIVRAESGSPYFSPSAVLERVNHTLLSDLMGAEQFVTAILLQYHPSTETIRYCCAGNTPPIIYRKKRDVFLPPPADYGPPIGVEAKPIYQDERLKLEKGDIICLFTDGLLAVKSPGGKRFESETLKRMLQKLASRPAQAILDRIHEYMWQFGGGVPLRDDVSICIIKVVE